jgi:NADH:ubiquinone oxidoreductase subunit K
MTDQKGDRGFEIMLSIMIIGLCVILSMYGTIPSNIKYAYYVFFSISFGAGIITIIMNVLSYFYKRKGEKTK